MTSLLNHLMIGSFQNFKRLSLSFPPAVKFMSYTLHKDVYTKLRDEIKNRGFAQAETLLRLCPIAMELR